MFVQTITYPYHKPDFSTAKHYSTHKPCVLRVTLILRQAAN